MDDLWTTWGAALGGMMAVNVLWLMVSSWIRLFLEVFRTDAPKRTLSSFLASSLVHAGPWALAGAIAFGIYVRASAWAPWFFAGAGVWTLFMIVIVWHSLWRVGREREKDAVRLPR